MRRVLSLALVSAAAITFAGASRGGACPECGCCRVKKHCRLLCEVKHETRIEYSCECEDFCISGPARRCGVRFECDECGRPQRRTVWKPTSARLRTRQKLVKHEISEEVPAFRWVVEETCCECGQRL